jgi:methylenetetrahydrofolate--tRNA-(uracil-5-)-methyltransferase
MEIKIIGAGLAGSEAAWQVANAGLKVKLYEMRGVKSTKAHTTSSCAELVCSNSFRNDEVTSAIGLLHQEMRLCDSLILSSADNNKLPAGGALAVAREDFSKEVEARLSAHPNIEIIREEISSLNQIANTPTIIATGPLTSDPLAEDIIAHTGQDKLYFFDAIAPIIYKDSIDFSVAWFQSRYDKVGPIGNGKDYINCPLNKEQYYNFVAALNNGEKMEFKEWEKDTPYFEGCMPVEVMAARGVDTLMFGPMKPVGLTNPHKDERPFAVVQLRQDNKLGTLFNMVGFQTKLKYGAQQEVFRMIPGLENAEFAKLGGIHRNSFINSPILLDRYLRLKTMPNIRFAGQITGVEGYVESAAIGLIAGKFLAAEICNMEISLPPRNSALGALLNHITEGANSDHFQPMNINYGLFPPLPPVAGKKKLGKSERQKIYSDNALLAIKNWLSL